MGQKWIKNKFNKETYNKNRKKELENQTKKEETNH